MTAPVRPSYGTRATASLASLALASGAFAFALDALLRMPLKLPGHRAFPGALSLLLLAEVAPAWLVCVFAAAVPLLGAAIGRDGLWLVAPWAGLAAVLVAARDARWRGSLLFLVGAGTLFGALRLAALYGEAHHTPLSVRLAGHLVFGALGGAAAAGVVHLHRGARDPA